MKMTTHQQTLQTLLTSGPYARAVEQQIREFDLKPEDREPPTTAGLFDGVPNPVNPYEVG
jgi:hypothetical protein